MRNSYIIDHDRKVVIMQTPQHKDVIFDLSDLSKVTAHIGTWHANQTDEFHKKPYVYTSDGKGHSTYLHRLLTDCPKGMCVDHRNSDAMDNRQINLQIVTRAENGRLNNKAYRELRERDQCLPVVYPYVSSTNLERVDGYLHLRLSPEASEKASKNFTVARSVRYLPKRRKKISEAMKKAWSDPEIRARRIEASIGRTWKKAA